jgi:hypothetical protein
MSQPLNQTLEKPAEKGSLPTTSTPVTDKPQLDKWAMSIDVNPDTLRTGVTVSQVSQTGVIATNSATSPVARDSTPVQGEKPPDEKAQKTLETSPNLVIESKPSLGVSDLTPMEGRTDVAEKSNKKRPAEEMISVTSGKETQPEPVSKKQIRDLLEGSNPNYDVVAKILLNTKPLEVIELLSGLDAGELNPKVVGAHFVMLNKMLETINPALARLCDFDHRIGLGRDPDQPNYTPRPDERDTGLRLELLLGKPMSRHKETAAAKAGTPVKGDWADKDGVIYDGCSPPSADITFTFKTFQSEKAYLQGNKKDGWVVFKQEDNRYDTKKEKNSFDIFLLKEKNSSGNGPYSASLKMHLEKVGGPRGDKKSYVVIDVMGRDLDAERILSFISIVNGVIGGLKDPPRAGVLLLIDGKAQHFDPGLKVKM